MLGIVFTELTDFIEERFGPEMVDDLLDETDLQTDGAFTAVGNYPHEDAVALVAALSEKSATPVPDLLYAFGYHLFGRFNVLYPALIAETGDNAFDFLSRIEGVIHKEVRKLYPEANPPRLEPVEQSGTRIILSYVSHRPMHKLAEGLIKACCDHFDEAVDISCREASADERTQGAGPRPEDHQNLFFFEISRAAQG